jgi:hypothetical protein
VATPWTVDEFCQETGFKPKRVYDMVASGILPPGVVIKFGRQLRIDPQAFREWARAGGSALPGGWRRLDDPERVATPTTR